MTPGKDWLAAVGPRLVWPRSIQYNTENFYSAGILGVAKFKAKIHQTENLSSEESLIRHQEIGKSTKEDTLGQKGAFSDVDGNKSGIQKSG